MPRFDAAQFVAGSAQCELASNLFALPPQQLPQKLCFYNVSLPQQPQDHEMLKQLLEELVGQYFPPHSVVLLGDARLMLDQPIGALMAKFLQEGAEGLTWTGVDGGQEAGTVGIAAADEEGNDQTLLLEFQPIALGYQERVHRFYTGEQPDRSHVSPYCDLVCQVYSYLLQQSDRFQQFHQLIVDKNSRAHIPFTAAYAGFSLAVRPLQAGLGLTLANTPLSTSTKHSLVDFAFHHMSRVFGSKETMLNLCQRNCRDAHYEQFQALRRRLRGSFVKFTDTVLAAQPPVAASMLWEVSDLLCVTGNLASHSPELFVRFQRFGLHVPAVGQIAHLPLACLMARQQPLEVIREQNDQPVLGFGDVDASDSSDDDQPKAKRRKGKRKDATGVEQEQEQEQQAASSTQQSSHDALEMKTDDGAQEAMSKSLDQFDLLVPMEWLEVVPGYMLPQRYQVAARERFIDSKIRQVQSFAEALGQACGAASKLGVQTNPLTSVLLAGSQLPPLAARYRSPTSAEFPQFLDQPVINGTWDLIHPTKHFAYRPHVDAWVVLSLCKLGTGKSSYGVSAAQVEYFLDALCETMARFGMEVDNLQTAKPIFFPNPNQSKFDAMRTIVQKFKLHEMDGSIIVVVHPPAMDEFEKAELQWLSMCHFGVPVLLVDINTVYENQPKKNKTERLLGSLAAEINLKCRGLNFKLGYPPQGVPGLLPDETDDIVASEPPEMLSVLFRDVQPYMCIGLSVKALAGRPDRFIYTACSSLDRSLARCLYEACITPEPPPSPSSTGSADAHCRLLADIITRLLMQSKKLTQRLPRMVLLYREVDSELDWRCQDQLAHERQAIEAALRDLLGAELDLHYVAACINHGMEMSVAGAWGNVSIRTLGSGTLIAHGAVDLRAQQFYLCSHKPESVDETTIPRYTVISDSSSAQPPVPLEALEAATYFLCHMHQASGKVGMLPAPLTYARQLQSMLDIYMSERHKDHVGASSPRDALDRDDYALELLGAEECTFVKFHPSARSGKMFVA